MRPIVEVTVSCRADGCGGRVHLHPPRRAGGLVGVCDTCGETSAVELPPDGAVVARRSMPLLVGVAP